MVIKDDEERHNYTSRNFGDNQRILVFAWTTSGTPTFGRSLLKFDLSKIPAHKTITKATLKLFGDTTVLNELTARLGGNSNAFCIKRVTESWDENSVSWEKQPASSTEYQVIVPQSVIAEGVENYSVDVTALINSMRDENQGIMFQLKEEQYYSRVSLASDDAQPKKKPVLIINYR